MNFNFLCFLVVCTAAGDLAQGGSLCKVNNEFFSPGEIIYVAPLGNCQAAICGRDAEIEYPTCPADELPSPGPGCTFVPEDTTKLYPFCCARYDCV